MSGFCFPIGSSTVVYTATDAAGNSATCTFNVTVQDICATDTLPPTIVNCPQNRNLSVAGDTCFSITWTAPTASDNCRLNSLTSNFPLNTCFPVGTNRVIYTATDAQGNRATCFFDVVVVNICAGDLIPPIIRNCPRDTTVTTTATCAVVTWQEIIVTDNCFTPRVSANFASGTCFPLGITTVVFTATDNNRNTATCSRRVNVIRPNRTVELDPELSEVHLFPNPTEGVVFLKLNSVASKKITVRFTDITGRLVFEKNQTVSIGENQFVFDLKVLPNAVYSLSLYEDGLPIYTPLRFVKM
jgi:hypothetical protein